VKGVGADQGSGPSKGTRVQYLSEIRSPWGCITPAWLVVTERPPTAPRSQGAKSVFSQLTLQDLGNLGEVVGALGVIVSLVYLARQMHQNTSSVRAASFNSMVQNSLRLLEHTFIDSEFASFLHKAETDPSALSPEERVRWDSYMTAVYRHFGNLVYQHRVGALDQEMWESYERTLRHRLRMPSWHVWFQENKGLFSKSLVEQVEGIEG
jgi:hypothetical protein